MHNISFYKVLVLTIFITIGFTQCSKDENVNTDNRESISESIVFLHVNDMHANIDAFAQISTVIKSVEDTCENVYVVCAGDIFSGNPMVDMHENKGLPIIDLMNKTGFDLSVIGNHEFDYGQEILNERILQAKFPFICANIDASSGILEQPEPYYTIKSPNGFEFVVLGLIETGTHINGVNIPSTHPNKVIGCEFPHYSIEIKKYTHLKNNENYFVVLSHLGFNSDVNLANDNSQIDLILGGHSHSTIDPPAEANKAIVCQAGSYGRYVGIVHIMLKGKSVTNENAFLKKIDDSVDADSEIANLVSKYNNNPSLNKKIGTAIHELTNKNEIGSLMTDALRWKYDCDIAFQNSGGIRSSFSQGDIFVKDVYQCDPFGNEVIKFELSYDEIISLLRNSSQGDLKPSGIRIIYDGQEIRLTTENGRSMNMNTTYTVAMNSYIATAYSFNHADEGESAEETSASVLIDFIQHLGEIDYKGINRITVK